MAIVPVRSVENMAMELFTCRKHRNSTLVFDLGLIQMVISPVQTFVSILDITGTSTRTKMQIILQIHN